MDMAYDALEWAPYMRLSLISLVLLALIVATGILVTIPAHIVIAIYHMVGPGKRRGAIRTRPIRGRPKPVAFALAMERKPRAPRLPRLMRRGRLKASPSMGLTSRS